MQCVKDIGAIWAINGTTIATVTLTHVKDMIAIALGIASFISTLIIIRNNLRVKPAEPTRNDRSSIKTVLLLLLLATLCLFCGGCTQVENGLFNRHEEVREHVFRVPPQTNVATDPASGKQVTVISAEHSVTNYSTNITFSVRPEVQTFIRTAQTVNSLANPTPSNPIIGWALGGIAAVLGVVAKAKSNKANLLPVLIEGIEKANDPKVKETIRQVSERFGVNKQLHREVKRITR